MTSNPIFSKSWISEKNEFSIFSIFQKKFFQQTFNFSKNRIGGQKTLKKIENFRQKIKFFCRKIWEMRVMSKSIFSKCTPEGKCGWRLSDRKTEFTTRISEKFYVDIPTALFSKSTYQYFCRGTLTFWKFLLNYCYLYNKI